MAQASHGQAQETVAADGAREYLIFAVGEGRYALPMAPVDEIIRVPEMTPVPLSPGAVVGAVNLRGRVVPVAALRPLLGYGETDADESARIFVTSARGGLGLLADAVLETTVLTPEQIRPANNVTELAELPWLDGVVHCDQGLVQCLDLERLVDAGNLEVMPSATSDAGGSMALQQTGAPAPSDSLHELLGIAVGDQTFALPLDSVVEILQEPQDLSPVPDGPEAMIGIADWRDRPLPLLDLGRHFGLSPDAAGSARRVLVVPLSGDRDDLEGPMLGLIADAAREVLRVPERQVDAVPEVMRASGQLDECSAVVRLEDGRLVSVLAPQRLVSERQLREAGEAAVAAEGNAAEEDGEQFVLFDLAGQAYGVPIAAVKEIIRPPETLTRVPRAPGLVEGALNLRGSILPLVGLRRYLGLGPVPEEDDARVLVLRRETAWLGFGVDAVLRVERISDNSIRPAPESATRHTDLLSRVAAADDGRMTLLLDPKGLAARVEAAAEEMTMTTGAAQEQPC